MALTHEVCLLGAILPFCPLPYAHISGLLSLFSISILLVLLKATGEALSLWLATHKSDFVMLIIDHVVLLGHTQPQCSDEWGRLWPSHHHVSSTISSKSVKLPRMTRRREGQACAVRDNKRPGCRDGAAGLYDQSRCMSSNRRRMKRGQTSEGKMDWCYRLPSFLKMS